MKDLARVLIRREATDDGQAFWIAQVLEYDLAAQAKTIEDLVYELQRTIVAHILCSEQEGLVPFESIPPAPRQYVDEWQGSPVKVTVEVQRFLVDQPTNRQPPELEMRLCA